jgi:hypothetical protein
MKQIGTGQIADGAVTGSKIAGTDKLNFGTCAGTLPSLAPGGSASFDCSDSNAVSGDEMVATRSGTRSPPSPVLINSVAFTGGIQFGFENPSSQATAERSVVMSYIIF